MLEILASNLTQIWEKIFNREADIRVFVNPQTALELLSKKWERYN
jgi:hypothetical protein